MANGLLVGGGLGVAGYFGYRWWQQEQIKETLRVATLAEAARLQAEHGMSTKDAITAAAATACTAGAAVYGAPPSVAGPLCKGVAVIAIKGAELAAKGAVIAGKAIGKGVVAGGKGIGTGAKFVAYTAPKKVIGTVVTKSVDATIGRILPKSAAKVVKKVFCLGIFCGVDGIDDFRGLYDRALGDVAGGARGRSRARGAGGRPSNPFAVHARAPGAIVGGAVARGVRRAGRSSPRRAGGPGRALRAS